MRRNPLIGIAAMLALLFSPALSQDERPFSPPGMMGGGGQRFIERLKLTDEQRGQFDQLRFDFAKQAVSHQAKVKTARLELAQLIKADSPDRAAIEKKMGEVSQLENQGKLLFTSHWFSVNKILTPDQQKIWKERLGVAWMHERAGRMRGMSLRPGLREPMRRFLQERRMGPLR